MDLPLDRELVVRAMAGDRLALDQLWCTHRRFVAAVLMAYLPGSADLQDLLQDVAMKMVGQIHGLKSAGSFRPWLRTVARNLAMSHGRKQRIRGPHASLPFDPIDPAHEDGPIREQLEDMLKIVQGLHVDYREPLLMRSVQGMSQRAIAEALDLPVTTIETRLARARRLLRRELSNSARQPSGGT
jgi:RNA polymerase sigma factor (sigma-70 family)